jgi:HEAT repeat protein
MNLYPAPVFIAVTPDSKPSQPAVDAAKMDLAFEALKGYHYGSSRAALMPIDEAVRNSLEDQAARKQLAQRLSKMLSSNLSPVAKEYICSQLLLIGSPESVPVLAGLLSDPALAHSACSALESMLFPEAGKALRRRLPTLNGLQKVGVINSLGMRREVKSVPLLARLLKNTDHQIVSAAAAALGRMGTVKAAHILHQFQPHTPAAIRGAVADACLTCAERLSAEGQRSEAQLLYRALTATQQPSQVREAAQRGLQAMECPL